MEETAASRRSIRIPIRPLEDIRFLGADAKSAALVLFLAAGSLKTGDIENALPIDFTVLMALVLAVIVIIAVVRGRFRVPRQILWIVLLFALFAVPVAWSPSTPYSHDKVARLFSLTFLSMAGSMLIIRTSDDLRRLLNAAALVSVGMVFVGLVTILREPDVGRLTVAAATTIALGQYAGATAIWVMALGLEDKHRRSRLLLTLLVPILIVEVAAGSRGPMVALAISVVVVGILHGLRGRTVLAGAFAIVVLLGTLYYGGEYLNLPTRSVIRVTQFLSGEMDESIRQSYLAQGCDIVRKEPFGIGWGGFGAINGESGRLFPHNLPLEVTMEAGWAAGAVYILIMFLAVYRTVAISLRTRRAEFIGLASILIFFGVSSLVSGEINDCKWLLAVVSIALAVQAPPSKLPEGAVETT